MYYRLLKTGDMDYVKRVVAQSYEFSGEFSTRSECKFEFSDFNTLDIVYDKKLKIRPPNPRAEGRRTPSILEKILNENDQSYKISSL